MCKTSRKEGQNLLGYLQKLKASVWLCVKQAEKEVKDYEITYKSSRCQPDYV